jgi:hypothetical protein
MQHEATLCDTSLVYLQTAVQNDVWHPPMALVWDFTLVKALDDKFQHAFPDVLVGSVFKTLRKRYAHRDFVHVIRRDDSVSFSLEVSTVQ